MLHNHECAISENMEHVRYFLQYYRKATSILPHRSANLTVAPLVVVFLYFSELMLHWDIVMF